MIANRFAALALSVVVVAPAPQATSKKIDITTKNDTEAERAVVEQVRRLLEEYPLDDWIFTDKVIVEADVIPHSHPVLTLNTRYVDDDVSQLATFIHEQFHWWAAEHEAVIDGGIAALRAHYPDAPGRAGGGARDQHSTYLHLIVCDIEYARLAEQIGDARARTVIEGWRHYPWVYERVLNDPALREINTRSGLSLRDVRAAQ